MFFGKTVGIVGTGSVGVLKSDIVAFDVPLNESAYHLISKEALDKMKQGAMLINTSHSGLVDTKALVECLKSEKLREAALDVMEDDTLASLISMPNTIVTSHRAFLTEEALKTIAESIVQSFLNLFLMN
ncbi:unnamed protein product [Rotaria sordida]|uniref:D-isomer specific 2-hydroxyacid dehydrogenase NAD-binding domain-containing protein n=1 Tax=Rotaria sordida TaxID=392033 RepID=A0A813MX31_9BILA|nr:unnamed protein product [Rotaria sordida]CAF0740673.1 unnamed protein product [Rotaria sordida]